MFPYIFVFLAYLSGSIPYGLIIAKAFGNIDVRKTGSGNIGATNVLRSGHKSLALATLLCDGFKGLLPVYGAYKLGIEGYTLLCIAYGAVIGHVFPVWLAFQGGKGVATSLGVFWALSPSLGLFATVMWGIFTKWLKISSLSALGAFLLSPIFAVLFLSWPLAGFCLAIAGLVFWTHRSNIKRLLKGKEEKITG